MTQAQAEYIAFNWHYDGPYAFYDMEADQEDLEEFLDAEKRENTMFAVTQEEDLVGFFGFSNTAESVYELSLGLRPDLTGKGSGLEFLKAGLDFVQSEYSTQKIMLSVAIFNKRAIKVYRKIGFKDVETFMQKTNGGTYEFLRMEYIV